MTQRIAIYTPDLSTGGVGKMRTHLLQEMVRRGLAVDLLLASTDSPMFAQVPEAVRIINVGTTHPIYSLPALYRYFRAEAPAVLITDRLRLNIACQRARALARRSTALFLSVHNPFTVKLDGLVPAKRAKLEAEFLKWAPRNRRIVAVSQGVADDLVDGLGLRREQIRVVHNPVITPALAERAGEPVDHPFFADDGVPVILSAGRMTEQKDFPTLIRAFQRVRQRRPVRLVVLGNHGREFNEINELIASLGLSADVSLPGYDPNPYRYMARAAVYVLSSRWEGFGNVIVEAMATGLPVVATDCPVGPREILGDAPTLGALVPIGDDAAMAAAIERMLDARPAPEAVKAGVARFTVERSVDGYLETFGLQ